MHSKYREMVLVRMSVVDERCAFRSILLETIEKVKYSYVLSNQKWLNNQSSIRSIH